MEDTNKCFYYEMHVYIREDKGYSFGIKSDMELNSEDAIGLAKTMNRFNEFGDWDLVDDFNEINEEDFKKWYPKEYNRVF